jgi:hypothetical protein
MIKLEKTDVMNMENAIRGMRNPLNSWHLSDSKFNWETGEYIIGPNDLSLAKRLTKAGSDHRKFLRQIVVSVDISAPLYWWKEFDTYKVGTVANSCSTMHKIQAKEFTRSDFSCDRMTEDALAILDTTIAFLEKERIRFVETKTRDAWHNMIQLLPTSYNQLRTVTFNYEVLLNVYHARRHHKLAEWHTLCDWIESLPYFKAICLEDKSDG